MRSRDKCRKCLRNRLVRLIPWAAALCCFAFPVWAGDDELVKTGRAIVQQNCSRCHAIGTTGESTHPKAPPFRIIVTRYPVEDLAEALAEGIVSGHPAMPQFVFEPQQINAILAYLNSLKAPVDSHRPP
jgi:cytochrome c